MNQSEHIQSELSGIFSLAFSGETEQAKRILDALVQRYGGDAVTQVAQGMKVRRPRRDLTSTAIGLIDRVFSR